MNHVTPPQPWPRPPESRESGSGLMAATGAYYARNAAVSNFVPERCVEYVRSSPNPGKAAREICLTLTGDQKETVLRMLREEALKS